MVMLKLKKNERRISSSIKDKLVSTKVLMVEKH